MKSRLAVLAILTIAAACDTADRVPAGTNEMGDTLAALHRRALAEPQRNPFENRARADAIAAEIARKAQFDPQLSYQLAQERLAAGQTREAIAEFESLIRGLRLSADHIEPNSKVVYDFLAMAWLRLGEQENCLTNSAENVCILPLSGAAKHVKEEGARHAVAVYRAILKNFPADLGSRWLMNLSYLSLGEYPDSVPPQFLIKGIQPNAKATFPLFHNIANLVGLGVDGNSGALVIEDFNRDGFLDLFMTSWKLTDPPKLLIADGKGGYDDKSTAAGLDRITGGLNATQADYDNDGFPDIFVMRGAWLGDGGMHPSSLLHNRGDGTVEDVTFAAGLASFHPTPTAAWADYDLDGKLDLFVGHESGTATGQGTHESQLFRNNGNGTFTDVSATVGLRLDAFVKGVTWGDVNNDGLPDLYASVLFGPNRLFINKGGTSPSDWRFDEVAVKAGVDKPNMSFPTWFWDYDQDGWDDILVLAYDVTHSGALHDAFARELVSPAEATGPKGVESSRLYRNNRNGTFTDVTKAAGLSDKVIFAMGANFGDIDNDGFPDFYIGTGNPDLRSVIPNRMFRNVAGKRFDEVTLEGGFGHIQKGHGTAFADLDRDGDADIYMVMGGAYEGDRAMNVLFENPGFANAWINLELEGRTANRSAIGARIRVFVTDSAGKPRTFYRSVSAGGSFGSGSLAQLIGVGKAQRVDSVGVTWPDAARSTSTFRALQLKRTYRIVQDGAIAWLNRPPVPFSQKNLGTHLHH